MLPSSSVFDSANKALFNAIFFSNNSLKSIIFANGINLKLFQFRPITAFTAVASVMAKFVKNVIFVSVPAKIVNMVIKSIAVIVATFHSFRTNSYKCFKNKFVGFSNMRFVFFPKINKRSVQLFINAYFFKSFI